VNCEVLAATPTCGGLVVPAVAAGAFPRQVGILSILNDFNPLLLFWPRKRGK